MLIENCTAAVLCGGKSSRMGFDKAFLQDDTCLLLQSHAQKLQSIFKDVVLVSNSKEKIAPYTELAAYPVLEDHYPGMGPLGGICTAFEETTAPYLFVMACDMPSPGFTLIPSMYKAIEKDTQVVVFEHEKRLETLFAFYHRSCLPVFQKQIQENKAQPRREFAQFNVKKIHLTAAQAGSFFINLNTAQDLEKWKKNGAGNHDPA